ncbi:hypothetical protein [Hymenobacter metallilatus]|uniref:Uncharacterized protein n=1 Tax=Hymenobacter metallilatus TaxID=2493666 RepID=A0A428JCR5_9BACT|nr:hypothetical protein [Hymenobacter metallilatus]RSK29841.1 hypothetical protein EI290_16020 [Hymenobacter metallilatus]
MAYKRYRTAYTFDQVVQDPDPQISSELYFVETWDFDTVTRTILYRDGSQNPRFSRYTGQGSTDPIPEDVEVLGEVHAECFGTTRRAYIHVGGGLITPQDTPNATECGFGALAWERVTPFSPAPGQTTGRVQLDTTGGTAPLNYEIIGPGPARTGQLNNDGWVEVTGLTAPATYLARVTDSSAPAQILEQEFRLVAAVVGGCTDRAANNFNPNARYEDGSCTYAPPVRKPVFRVPRLNPLRFVLEQATDTCAVFETLDNTLFCHQTRPGQQLRPLFRQKVQFCDLLALQVHTDFTAVQAEIYRPQTGQLVRTQPLVLVQRLTGLSDPLAVSLREYSGGLTALIAEAGALPPSLRRAGRLTLNGGASGTYRVREVAWLDGEQVLVLTRPWAPAAGDISARWQLDIVDFNVWEAVLNLSGLAAGDYQVKLRGTDATEADVVAVSEPLHLAAEHHNTVVVEYRNRDNAFGMVWTTGMQGRLRLPGTFFRRKPASDATVHRSSSGVPTMLSSAVRRQLVLETAGLPDWLHEQLTLVFRLDEVRVQGRAVLAPDAYEATELRNYPLSAGQVTLELLDGFGTGNSTDNGALPTTDDSLLELRQGGFLKLH